MESNKGSPGFTREAHGALAEILVCSDLSEDVTKWGEVANEKQTCHDWFLSD